LNKRRKKLLGSLIGGGGSIIPFDNILLEDGTPILLELDSSYILLENLQPIILLEDNSSLLLEDGTFIYLE
jgi:hypothetical protein